MCPAHLLRLLFPLLFSRPVSAVCFLMLLLAGFGGGLPLLSLVVVALVGLPLWVGALGFDIVEL